MKHEELIKLYFELEKLLQQDRNDEVSAVEKIINDLPMSLRKESGGCGHGLSEKAKHFLDTTLLPIRDKIKNESKPANFETTKIAGVIMQMLKEALGQDLEEIIKKKRELEIEKIAKDISLVDTETFLKLFGKLLPSQA